LLKAIGTEMATADFYSKKTAAEQTTWWTAWGKSAIVKAIGAPAAGTVGASCKAAAVVAPATKGVRPTCAATDCCMGLKAKAEDTTNYTETCQLKTATKGKVTTTAAEFISKDGFTYNTKVAVTADYVGACIEGAMKTTSAALTVIAAAYMMA